MTLPHSGSKPARKRPSARRKAARSSPKRRAARVQGSSFGIVGVGASAGGLEAFTKLLQQLPVDTGLAYVLVQHLSPDHDSALTLLLGRATPLPVLEVRDGMRLKPDTVYVIPPNTNLAVLHHRLTLVPRTEARGHYLPIDHFLQSLAEDQKNRAIGVILSGTGSDGTEGLRAIKAAGGLTFAQEEKSAKYDGMPHSAIAANLVDFVLPPEEIARELARIGRHPYLATPFGGATDTIAWSEVALNQIFTILRAATGVDFSGYKHPTLKRRIARRLLLHKIDTLPAYARLLRESPGEVKLLHQDLLINVTEFFRDPEALEALKKKAFPRLLKARPSQSPIRVWVPGCSTGEEAYSIAMCLLEFLGHSSSNLPIQIFGTDLSERAIEQARQGIYPESISTQVTPERLRRFFIRQPNGYQICKSVRDLCVFARQDVTRDPPFSKLDLISCRNVLIYLGAELQKRVVPLFHYALNPAGLLLLGSSESIGIFADLFSLIDARQKLYVRKTSSHRAALVAVTGQVLDPPESPQRMGRLSTTGNFDYQREADRILLSHYTPASVLVNEHMDILQFRGQTGSVLAPAPGLASLNLFKMAREGLLLELRSAVSEAKKRKLPARRPGIQVRSDAGWRQINLEVVPIGPGDCFLVLFQDMAAAALPASSPPRLPAAQGGRLARGKGRQEPRLQEELAATREYLQSMIEEHERTNEDLQSANEEILSSNEELQSTNEELETAKEELQSSNEELNTVNEELHTRNSELGRLNSDLVNLLTTAQIPVVMLSLDLRIRRFTEPAGKLLNLIPGDVGRPFADLRPNLVVPDFESLIVQVMDTLTPKEFETQDQAGRWYSVRIRPYKTMDNRIDGVVVALIEIDELKRSLATARQERAFAEAMVETMREPLLVVAADLRVTQANRAFYQYFRLTAAEVEGRFIYALGNRQWNLPRLRELLEDLLPKNNRLEDFELEVEFPGVGRKRFRLNACRLPGEESGKRSILLTLEEQTG